MLVVVASCKKTILPRKWYLLDNQTQNNFSNMRVLEYLFIFRTETKFDTGSLQTTETSE